MKYTDVEWDDAGRLIIKNRQLAEEIKAFVSAPRDANTKGQPNPFLVATNLFQVVEDPKVPDPMDLVCRIVVDFPHITRK